MDYHEAVLAVVQLLADSIYASFRDDEVERVVNHISPYEREKALAEAQRIVAERYTAQDDSII